MKDSIEIASTLIKSVFIELDVAIITARRNSDDCSVCAIEGMKNRLAMAARELECFKNSPAESGDTDGKSSSSSQPPGGPESVSHAAPAANTAPLSWLKMSESVPPLGMYPYKVLVGSNFVLQNTFAESDGEKWIYPSGTHDRVYLPIHLLEGATDAG